MGAGSHLFQVVGEGEGGEVSIPCQGAGVGVGAGSSRSQTGVEVAEVLGETRPLSLAGEVGVGAEEEMWSLSLARGVARVGAEGVGGEPRPLGLAEEVGVGGAQGWSCREEGWVEVRLPVEGLLAVELCHRWHCGSCPHRGGQKPLLAAGLPP